MQTLGFLIDQLNVVNLKMWNIQELLYEIRRMTQDDFLSKYDNPEDLKNLFDALKKACDLNVQRANVSDEIDSFVVALVKQIQSGDVDLSKLIQKKHKTY